MLQSSSLTIINVKEKNFDMLMKIYEKAQKQVLEELMKIKEVLNNLYGYDAINNITARIKTPDSIIKKMKKKNYKLTYQNLIEKVNDIAGIRIICPMRDNIITVVNIIEKMPNIKIIKEKDYLTKPKQSGYTGYHLIVQTYVEIEERKLPIKVEIQLRTMAMDFWSTNEHKLKYKSNKKISIIDSKKLTIYAKILNLIDSKITKMYQKQSKRQLIHK